MRVHIVDRRSILAGFQKLRDEHRLVRKGRWGPRWLHRLVWRAATNLGMIQHPSKQIYREEIRVFDTSRYSSVMDEMAEAILAYCNAYGAAVDEVEVVASNQCFDGLLHDDRLRSMVDRRFVTQSGQRGRVEIMGVPEDNANGRSQPNHHDRDGGQTARPR